MRTIVIAIAGVLLAVWSLFAWAVYALLGYAGELAATNSDLLPIAPEWVFWMAGLLGGMGAVAVWIVWGLGAAAIVIPTLILLAFMRGARGPARRHPHAAAFPTAPLAGRGQAGPQQSGADAVQRVLGRLPPRDNPPR